MATENPVLVLSFPATANLASSQFYAMELATAGVAAANATTDVCIGILQNDPASGGTADVCVLGKSKAVAGAAISINAKVSVTAAGRLQTAATGQHVLGIALEAASGDGAIFTMLVCPGGAPLP